MDSHFTNGTRRKSTNLRLELEIAAERDGMPIVARYDEDSTVVAPETLEEEKQNTEIQILNNLSDLYGYNFNTDTTFNKWIKEDIFDCTYQLKKCALSEWKEGQSNRQTLLEKNEDRTPITKSTENEKDLDIEEEQPTPIADVHNTYILKEMKVLEKKNKVYQEKIKELQKVVYDKEKAESELEQELDEKTQLIKQLRREIEEKTVAVEDQEYIIQKMKTDFDFIVVELKKKVTEAECPRNLQMIEEKDEIIKNKDAMIKNLNGKISDMQNEAKLSNETLDHIRNEETKAKNSNKVLREKVSSTPEKSSDNNLEKNFECFRKEVEEQLRSIKAFMKIVNTLEM